MGQRERRRRLIDELLAERKEYAGVEIPADEEGQKQLLRGLFNIRMPGAAPADFIRMQDEYLAEEARGKGIVVLDSIPTIGEVAAAEKNTASKDDADPQQNERSQQERQTIDNDIYIWQGDITTLAVDAIVNAANSGMTGCWMPNHKCIDNAIHTFAGVQLRNACQEYMDRMRAERGGAYAEPTGGAVITPGFNLPAKNVIHTVGPIISGPLTTADERSLASCYQSCLEVAAENELESIAFCCISTGEFHFPNERAAEIAVDTVLRFKEQEYDNAATNVDPSENITCSNLNDNAISIDTPNGRAKDKGLKVVFNVFKNLDREIYERLLCR